jgi:hypothetical protein
MGLRHLDKAVKGATTALLDRLRAAQFPFEAAIWIYLEEPDEWRLIVATPMIHSAGPAACHGILRDIIGACTRAAVDRDFPIGLFDIFLYSPADPIFPELAAMLAPDQQVTETKDVDFSGLTLARAAAFELGAYQGFDRLVAAAAAH